MNKIFTYRLIETAILCAALLLITYIIIKH